MSRSIFPLSIMLLMVLVSGCLTGSEKYISKREPAPVMAATKVPDVQVPKAEEAKPRELFVRQKEVKIRRKAPINETGSLTDLNDPRAYLFGFERPLDVGSYIDVKVASNRVEPKSGANKESSVSGTTAEAPATSTAENKQAAPDDAKSILKSIPNLEPHDGHAALITSMKMQIMERFDNGDVLVMHRRRSMRDGQASEVVVTSRLPSNALSKQDMISTNDLSDVAWKESFDGEVAERKSANWEDEYTMRLSGFEETKSKRAMDLDAKRDQLKLARDKLEKDMKAHIGEREKMTAERAALLDEKSKNSEKIQQLESSNSDLQKKVSELEDGEEKSDTKKADNKAESKTAKKADDKKPDDKKAADKKQETKKAEAKK